MSETPLTAIGDEAIEARIVAWVLGEASAFEIAELERLCEERAELMIFKRRMAALHGMIGEAEKPQHDQTWKISAAKRVALLDQIAPDAALSEKLKESRVRHSALRSILAIAACLIATVIILGLSAPMVIRQRKKSDVASARSMAMQRELAALEEEMERSDHMMALRTELPSEQLEGTPMPMVLPNQTPSRKAADSVPVDAMVMQEKKVSLPMDRKPSAPSSSNSKATITSGVETSIPVPEVALNQPSLDFGDGDSFGKGWGNAGGGAGSGLAQSTTSGNRVGNAEIQPGSIDALVDGRQGGLKKDLSTLKDGEATADPFWDTTQVAQAGTSREIHAGYTSEYLFRGEDLGADKKTKTKGEATQDALPQITTRSLLSADEAVTAAKQLREVGKYDEARSTLEGALATAPSDPKIANELAYLDDPIRTNPALTYEHEHKVDEVRRDLYKAEGNYNLGKYDEAKKEYENVLRTDPYNSAARKGMEKLAAAKSDYYRAAYDHTRSELLSEVDNAWELEVPAKAEDNNPESFKKSEVVVNEAPKNKEFDGFVNYGSPIDGKEAQRYAWWTGDESKKVAAGEEVSPPTDSVRAQLLADVERAWELAVPADTEKPEVVREFQYPTEFEPPESPEALTKAIREQEDKVEERRKVLATIVRTKGIVYKWNDSSQDQGASSALNMYHTLEQQKAQLESQISSLEKYDSDQRMVYASGLDLPDNAIRQLYPQYQQAQRQLESYRANGLSNNHPTVKDAQNQMDAMKRQLDESVVTLRATLKAQSDLVTDRLKNVEIMKDESREKLVRQGLDTQDYEAAKKEFEREQALLQAMKGKISKLKEPEPKPDLTKLIEEISAADEPYSTFSLNISDTSFRIAQAAMAKGERPDPSGVKVEQFYNAVDYGDPSPRAGEPVACFIEQAAHPVIPGRNLVRVALKTAAAGRSATQPLRLTLLVDQSGSMSRADRRAAMDAAMRSLGTLLTDKDLVTVIGFSRTPRLLADGMKGDEVSGKLAGLVNQSASEGGTNLEEAIKLAEQKAMGQKLVGAQNRIVLFTDGAANLGDANPERLAAKVEQLRQQGIAFDIAGIAADDLNDELLAELARKGNGRYSVVGKGEEQDFAKQLAGAFRPAAENVKVQVRFNPERVARYKLIGFEKDRLKTEDFRNDAVDAAELAAEEAGVAIYQIEPLPEGRGEIGEVSVRFRDTASGAMVERMWTMAHDPATHGVDSAVPSMQLAVLSMLAGEKIKGGPLADAIDFKQFAEPQAAVKQAFGRDPRVAEMLQMVDALK
jgi:secreted protein with Ig-like and vWFA domain